MAVPKLRFKEFDGDWNKNTIGNFVLNYKGGASLTPADFVEYSDCEVIPKKAISSGGLLQLDKVVPTFCTLEFFNSNQNYIVDSEYLITTLRDLVPSGPSIGYIVKYESNKKYILAQGVYGFRIKNDLNRDFLIQFSNTSKFRLHMQSIMVGSTQVHIRNQDYFSTELYTPSLIEQTKIASFLSNVDEKISQLTQKHALLSQYKQGMMQKLFSQQIRFKADDGSAFGEWEDLKICDLVRSLDAGVSVNSEDIKPTNDEYSVLKTSCISSGYFDENERKRVLLEEEINRLKEPVLDNSILMSRMNTPLLVGMNAYIEKAPKNTYLPDRLWQLKINADKVLTRWLAFYLGSENGLSQIRDLASGTSNSMKNIKKSDVLNLEIFVPSKEEQTKIANFLSAVDQKIEVVAQQIEQAKTWKKGLLQQMFV